MMKKISVISALSLFLSACMGGGGPSSSSIKSSASAIKSSSSNLATVSSSLAVSSSLSPVSSAQVSSAQVSSNLGQSSSRSSSSVTLSSSVKSSSPLTPSSAVSQSSRSAISSSSLPSNGLSAFEQTLRPLLVNNQCVFCHSDTAGVYQSPMFAHSDALFGEYELISAGKVNFDRPEESRIVAKIGNAPLHNCGSTLEECQSLATKMSDAIAQWSQSQGAVGANATSPLQSGAQKLTNKTLKPILGKRQGSPIAAYDFVDCDNNVIKDVSGVQPPIDLINKTNARCVLSLGLVVPTGSYVAASPEASRRVNTAVQASKELSIEAWVKAQARAQTGPYGAIVAYAPPTDIDTNDKGYDPTPNNFHLSAWIGSSYLVSEIYKQPPPLVGGNADGFNAHTGLRVVNRDYDTQFVHVAAVYQGTQAKLYVNGVLAGEKAVTHPAGTGWRDDFHIALGKSFYRYQIDEEMMQFGGIIGYAAIYDKALTPEQVANNATIPSGRKHIVRFDVATLLNKPGTYIEMGVRELGGGGYVFFEPTLYGPNIQGTVIKNMAITVNGRVNTLGQSFAAIDTVVDQLNAEGGFLLSTQGTTILTDQGAEIDQFTLAFDQIGDKKFDRATVSIPQLQYRDDASVSRISGIKIADHLHNTFSAALGVTKKNPVIANAFATVKDSLPVTTNLAATKSIHQIIIANMAYTYCEAMVNDKAASTRFFTRFNPASTLNADNTAALFADVYQNVIAPQGADMSRADFDAAMTPLVKQLTATSVPTVNIAVAVCGSSLASAAVTTY